MRTGAGDCGRLTLEEEAGSGDGHAAYSRRRDRAALEWRGASSLLPSVRPSLRPPGKQLTAAAATAGPHSRAPLSAMSFILHQLISFQTYNSEGRRRRGGASVAAPSLTRRARRGATEQRSYAQNSLAPITRLPGPVAGGRPAPGLAEISTLYTQKTTGFPRSLARFPPFSRSSSLGLIR